MNNWMNQLAVHFARMRRRYPYDVLMILFDIDGAIVDMRYLIRYVLSEFDRSHGTNFFGGLKTTDIAVHENHVDVLLDELGIPQSERRRIMEFWNEERWSTDSMMESHRPFVGVMEVIRWFQIQPKVVVGLNTGRPESLRADTLQSLNTLGEKYNVRFKSEHLHMNVGDWEQEVPQSKVAGVRRFQRAGYKVFAIVDNEPTNLAAVAELDECDEIIPLHAETIFESDSGVLPSCSACGKEYVLSDLVDDGALPQDIQFVWHGVNDPANLRQFLASDVQWGEVDIRTDPRTGELILHHDLLGARPATEAEPLGLDEVALRFKRFGKSIKYHFKETAAADRVTQMLRTRTDEGGRLWFNGDLAILRDQEIRKLRKAFPSSIIQCPIDFLIPRMLNGSNDAQGEVARLKSKGISRVSIEWDPATIARAIGSLHEWGMETNIYNVPDLDSFLQAVLLQPHSITADFNFPKWHYYGRGSGQDGRYHEYSMESDSPPP